MTFPENIDPRIWTLTNADCDGTISEQEMQELELLLDADPSAREFYVDFLKFNAEILWLMSAKQHGTRISGSVSAAPATNIPYRSPFLVFWVIGRVFSTITRLCHSCCFF